MSTVKTNNVQVGLSLTSTDNFTWYQPTSPDGTIRLGNGNSGTTSSLITVDSSGNVGVGTTSPHTYSSYTTLSIGGSQDGVLDVSYSNNNRGLEAYVQKGGTTASDLQKIYGFDSADNVNWYLGFNGTSSASGFYLGTYPSQPVTFWTNNTERMRIDSNGNVGIGVTPSAWATYKAIDLPDDGYISSGNSWFALLQNAYYNSGYRYKGNGYASQYLQQSGAHSWHTAASGTAGNGLTFTQQMTLDTNGNLGIGTVTNPTSLPDAKLTVSAGTPANGISAFFAASATNGSFISLSQLGAYAWGIGMSAGSADLAFFANKYPGAAGTERMRIFSSGGVSINNTVDPGAGNLSVSGVVSDNIGNLRTIVQNQQSGSGSYTLIAADAGKHIYVTGTGGVTMPVSVFSVGQAITIVNNTSSSITITGPSSGTMYLAGTATTGNRTLAQRGICTVMYVVGGATPTIIASGAGLT